MFYFFGRLLGKAFFDRIPLNLCLNRSIYNALLNKVTTEDYADLKSIKYVDTSVYNSLKWVQENDPALLEQVFTATSAYNIERELK